MHHQRSQELFAKAKAAIPGGVSSPVRAFGSVGGDPLFISRATGPFLVDADNNRYIDYVCSWGPLILGHAAPEILHAVSQAAQNGTSFGAATPSEVELAARIKAVCKSIDKVRFVNSGTEATMSALRLARGFTGRDKLLKFEGCYHGHADPFLSKAGSGVATLGLPGCAGIPTGAAGDTITVPYNDLKAAKAVFANHSESIAAVFVEPLACNMGMVKPAKGFLQGLRKLCDRHKTVLIFDEVITGFRMGPGGAQEYYDVSADLTTFGKVIGGGLPVGAYGGRGEIMDMVAPDGPVYQAGTLSGNPLAMAAGIATLDAITSSKFFSDLTAKCCDFYGELDAVLKRLGAPAKLLSEGSIFYLWFAAGAQNNPSNYDEIKTADGDRFVTFFRKMLEQGINIAPSPFEVGFISRAHTSDHLNATVTAIEKALR